MGLLGRKPWAVRPLRRLATKQGKLLCRVCSIWQTCLHEFGL